MRAISELNLDLAVVAAYGRILPDALLALPRLGMVNVHASLLPRVSRSRPGPPGRHRRAYRRPASRSCESSGSWTPVRCWRPCGVRLRPTRRASRSSARSRRSARRCCCPWSTQLAAGAAVETPQDDALATYAPKITKAEGAIDWSLPAARIQNLVRGLQPWPLVSAWLDGAAIPASPDRAEQRGDAPGREARSSKRQAVSLKVAGGDGRALRVLADPTRG